jgi:hypothetical protein
LRLQTVGIRGLVDELIAALDSTLNSGKLMFACVVSTLGALAMFGAILGARAIHPEGHWLAEALSGIVAGVALGIVATTLTRQTHMELSRMKRVPRSEALRDIGPILFRVFLAFVATFGVGFALLTLLQHVPDWLDKPLRTSSASVAEAVYSATWAISLAIGIVVGCVFLVSLLLPPILVVEECSLGDALREWRALLNEHRARVLVYEGMALGLALITALPLIVAVSLAQQYVPAAIPNKFGQAFALMIRGLTIGPALAFLAIANLFIYLNLRYEHSDSK